jgi:hypothetical protein
MFSSIAVPVSTRTIKPRFTDEELETAISALAETGSCSDHQLYDVKVGKQEPRTRAYYAGWYLRAALAACGEYTEKQLKVKTWAADGGFRWALTVK